MSRAAELLTEWQAAFGGRTRLDELHQIADSMVDPRGADVETCWRVTWPIPLRANTMVSISDGMVERLGPFMTDAWRSWGEVDGPVTITHKGGSNRVENFTIGGPEAARIEECRVARHRLLAIQGAAAGFRSIVSRHGPKAPFATFAGQAIDELVPELMSLFGRGWGAVTVLHLLTDLGLAVKPDLHLVRTVHSLGLVPGLDGNAVPNLQGALAIDAAVKKLAAEVHGRDYSPRDLRFLDALLMEASRQRLIQREDCA